MLVSLEIIAIGSEYTCLLEIVVISSDCVHCSCSWLRIGMFCLKKLQLAQTNSWNSCRWLRLCLFHLQSMQFAHTIHVSLEKVVVYSNYACFSGNSCSWPGVCFPWNSCNWLRLCVFPLKSLLLAHNIYDTLRFSNVSLICLICLICLGTRDGCTPKCTV